VLDGAHLPAPVHAFPPGAPLAIRALFRGERNTEAAPVTSPYTGLNLTEWPLDLQGWNGDPELAMLVEKVKPHTAIEVGAWKGLSTDMIATAMERSGVANPFLVSVDTWLGAVEFMTARMRPDFDPIRSLYLANGYPHVYYQFLANMAHKGHTATVLPLAQASVLAGKFFQVSNVRAQYIYIDASHEEDDVFADVSLFFPLLDGPTSVIIGDDIDWPSVAAAVNRFVLLYCQAPGLPHRGNAKWWLFASECTPGPPRAKGG
jgi:hypothetical protein